MLTECRALIVDPDPQGRDRLCESLRAIVLRPEIVSVDHPAEFLQRLKQRESFDIGFVSSRCGQQEIEAFFQEFLGAALEKIPNLIITLPPVDQDSAFVSRLYANGPCGFICYPYSPSTLLELMQAAQAEMESSADSGERRKKIMRFLLGDAAQYLDELAENKLKGRTTEGSMKKSFLEISATLRRIAGAVDEVQLAELLQAQFDGAKPFVREGIVRQAPREAPDTPGAAILAAMKERGVSSEKVLTRVDISPDDFDLLLRGEKPISEYFARELARALGRGPEYWLDLQQRSDRKETRA